MEYSATPPIPQASGTDALPDRRALLISPPTSAASQRISAAAVAHGVRVDAGEQGLRLLPDPNQLLSLAVEWAKTLSPADLHETRVATPPENATPGQTAHAMFRAVALDTLLARLREQWLADVLARHDLVTYFQPLIQYPPGRIHGYECLSRGRDASGNIIPPGRLFHAAAVLGLGQQLDEACRHTAIASAGALEDPSLSFFINFMPSAVRDPKRTLADLTDRAAAAGLRPQQIVFEVVETDKLDDHRHLAGLVRYFRKAGFKIALDDVGAGYSSLLALSYIRPDYIKLDGELVRRAAESSLEAKLVADLADTARQNGIMTIAEGIETEQHLCLALQAGIRITQGYMHAQPSPHPLTAQQLQGVVLRASAAAPTAPRLPSAA